MCEALIRAGRRFILIRAGEQTFGTAEEMIADFGGEFRRDIACGFDSKEADTL